MTDTNRTDPIAGRTVLITGANRGLGQALVEEVLRRDARHVYAAARRPLAHSDERVTPILLDVTDEAQVEAAAKTVEDLDVLINNAGVSTPEEIGDRASLDRHLAVNLYGPWALTRAFRPHVTRAHGTVVNVLSLAAIASLPMAPAYSMSKAAALSLTQATRALLAADGVRVHAVMAGPIDTEMSRDLPIQKTPPETVARNLLDAVAAGTEDIFPDPWSAELAEAWTHGPVRKLEQDNSALLAQLG
ncbi:SDR family NAD(P)-dependent oxidoreductase [Catenulispora subtropica]|uniref:SDR family oxidoreductase n=1 Tax=Catenulispora subtropica TaxID=450798 RepID=A0ABP5DP55_9ACTN